MYIKMNDDECYVAKFNGVLKQNCYIVRKDYSFARKYDKCLQKIENIQSILQVQIKERNQLLTKLKSWSNSAVILSQIINDTDFEIDGVEREIEATIEKIDRVRNVIMLKSGSLTHDDELKLVQKQLALALLNTLKYSDEIKTMEAGFDMLNRTEVENFYNGQWGQFQME